MKQCKRCLATKPREDFFGQTRNKDGLRLYCKACDMAQYKKNLNKEKKKEYHKEYYEKNKLSIKLKRCI